MEIKCKVKKIIGYKTNSYTEPPYQREVPNYVEEELIIEVELEDVVKVIVEAIRDNYLTL